MDIIEIPFGAKDSELKGWEYTIPEGMEATIENGKIVVSQKDSDDERIRKHIIEILGRLSPCHWDGNEKPKCIAYLEKQKHSLNFDAISSWLRDHASNYVNGEFNEFHHCVEYDGTINTERLIADLKVAVDGGAFDVDAKFEAREPRDNWEYIKEFCDKFGRMPKDMDELDVLVSYVMDKKQKEPKDYRKRYEDIAKSEWFKKAYEGKSLGCDDEQKEPTINHLAGMKGNLPLGTETMWHDEPEDGLLIRFAFYTYKDEDGILYLSNVFVEETSRNKGFGTKILQAAEKVAETIGATTIRLKVKEDSPADIWYRKNGYSHMKFEDGYDWLEKNIEYMKPAKQEWSGDEMNILDSIIDDYEKAAKSFCGYDGKIMLLKAIRDGEYDLPKKDWTEEDETCLEYALWCVMKTRHFVAKDACDLDACRCAEKWLESLHPSWKPSEEQMEALESTERWYSDNMGCNPALYQLLCDLKKL